MTNVTAVHAKAHFSKLLDRVSRGEEVVITRDKRPIARLVPEATQTSMSVAEAVDQLRALRKKIDARHTGKSRVSLAQWKSAVAEGRR